MFSRVYNVGMSFFAETLMGTVSRYYQKYLLYGLHQWLMEEVGNNILYFSLILISVTCTIWIPHCTKCIFEALHEVGSSSITKHGYSLPLTYRFSPFHTFPDHVTNNRKSYHLFTIYYYVKFLYHVSLYSKLELETFENFSVFPCGKVHREGSVFLLQKGACIHDILEEGDS